MASEQSVDSGKTQNMTGKVCLVTGATSGIGTVTARRLAELGATLVIVGRDANRTQSIATEIKRQTGNQSVDPMVADLSNQAQIRGLAREFKSRYQRLDVLINNAGAHFSKRHESADGIEMTLALNHLGYFLLTNLLLDTIKSSAPARIINVSSRAHERAKFDFSDPQGSKNFGGWRAYCQSKLANLLFTYELARRLNDTGVTVNALHPGVVATSFGANNGGWWRVIRPLLDLVSISAEEGAKTTIYLATAPELATETGKYFVKSKAVQSSPASNDRTSARQLWDLSVQLTGKS